MHVNHNIQIDFICIDILQINIEDACDLVKICNENEQKISKSIQDEDPNVLSTLESWKRMQEKMKARVM